MPFLKSVVTQLVTFLVVGGIVLSAGLASMEWQRAETQLRLDLAQRATVRVRSLQNVLNEAVRHHASVADVQALVATQTSDDLVLAMRVTGAASEPVEAGDWSGADDPDVRAWVMRQRGFGGAYDIDLGRPILVWAPFAIDDRTLLVEALLDVPGARQRMYAGVFKILKSQWLLLSVMTLMGLLLVRRRFTEPLSQVVTLARDGADSAAFADHAGKSQGEFALLAESIADMLARLDQATGDLRRREAEYSDLYQFAPAALVNLGPAGKIIKANDRAVALLGAASKGELIGRPMADLIAPDDRAALRGAIDRLGQEVQSRCELRVVAGEQTADTAVEVAAVRDDAGRLLSVRLSMLDVSRAKQLQDRLTHKSRLLNLIIDHMSDAILLADETGRIIAHNQQMASLLGCGANGLIGRSYRSARFWSEMGIQDEDKFLASLGQIEAEGDRPAQDRVRTRVGSFLFQGIPVHDAEGKHVGRLWVIQEITAQEQAQRLLQQQTTQLSAIKQLCRRLCDIGGTDDLLVKTAEHLWDVLRVEAVGLAVRRDDGRRRSRQILHRGAGPCLLDANRALLESVEAQLMPQVLSSNDASCWPELTQAQPWARAFHDAGLTSVAGVPLRASADPQGVLWIARHGGEPIGRHQTYLMEALAPLIAARIGAAELRRIVLSMELTDPVTDLPNRRAFENYVQRLGEGKREGEPWTIAIVSVDVFTRLVEMTGDQDGERLLRSVGSAIRSVTRRSTYVARVGQSVFAVIVPGLPQGGGAALGERLSRGVAAVQVQRKDGQGTINLTASIGLASFPEDGQAGLMIAEVALARAENVRRAGGGRVISAGGLAERQAG